MFYGATSFKGDLSKWDVSSVTNMNNMFTDAKSFKQKLCGLAWIHSKASKNLMFEGSPGSISRTVCEAAPSPSTRKHVTHRPIPDRELIVRTPTTTLVSTPTAALTIANTVTCLKCGTFKKSGRVSCCAPDGTWYKNCGGVGNKHVGHSWSEGAQACKCKFNVSSM